MSIKKNPGIIVVVFAALVLISFLVIANPFGLEFLNDDFIHIPLAAQGHFFHSNLLRPVADLTLWIDHFFWGWNAAGFHCTNLAIHLANCILVYLLLVRIFDQRKEGDGRIMAIAASLLFLMYAFHSESIFWIIGRGGSLAAFFMLVSLNCYERSKRTLSLFISLTSFAIGLFAYEFVWMLPVLIIAFQCRDHYVKQEPFSWKWSMGFLVVFAVFLLIRAEIGTAYFSNYETGALRDMRLGKLFTNYAGTLARCFVPPSSNSLIFILASASAAIVLLVALIFLRKNKISVGAWPVLSLVCLLLSCLPSVSLGIDTHDGEGGRFLYVPSVFCCWFIVETCFLLFRSRSVRFSWMILAILFHGYFLYASSKEYRYASLVVRTSLECLSGIAGSDTLIAESLPTQYKGALIFRSGFENALAMSLPGRFSTIRTVSRAGIIVPVQYRCAGPAIGGHASKVYVRWDSDGSIHLSEAIR